MFLKIIFIILGFIVCTFTLLPALICSFFAIPYTVELYNQGCIKFENKNLIIKKYIFSTFILLLIYVSLLVLISYFFKIIFLKMFLLGGILMFIIGKSKGNLIKNNDNKEEYILKNKVYIIKNTEDMDNKEQTKGSKCFKLDIIRMENLSEKIRDFSEGTYNSNDFLNIFTEISIANNYTFSSLLNTEYSDEDYDETIMSFCNKMDKILFQSTADAYLEFLVFNFYANIFFKEDVYDGKFLLSEADKDDIISKNMHNLSYTQEEKNLIRNLEIPHFITVNKDDTVEIDAIEADDSFEVRKVKYRINKDHNIIKTKEVALIPLKILY